MQSTLCSSGKQIIVAAQLSVAVSEGPRESRWNFSNSTDKK